MDRENEEDLTPSQRACRAAQEMAGLGRLEGMVGELASIFASRHESNRLYVRAAADLLRRNPNLFRRVLNGEMRLKDATRRLNESVPVDGAGDAQSSPSSASPTNTGVPLQVVVGPNWRNEIARLMANQRHFEKMLRAGVLLTMRGGRA